MNFLIDSIKNLKGYLQLKEAIDKEVSPIGIYGVTDAQVGHMTYSILSNSTKPILVLASDNLKARKIFEDLNNLGIENVGLYTKRDIFLYERDAKSQDNMKGRILSLQNLALGRTSVIVSTIDATRDKISDIETFKEHILSIKQGEEIDVATIEKKLFEMGYERYPQVEGIGQFSIRGSIIDIYTPLEAYRIELFDVEVDSIRSFDVETQRSIENLKEIEIAPVTDIIILDEDREKIVANLKDAMKKSKLEASSKNRLEEKFSKYIDKLQNNLKITNTDLILPFIPESSVSSVIDYFEQLPIVLIEEPNTSIEKCKRNDTEEKSNLAELLSFGEALKSHENIQYNLTDIIIRLQETICITLNTLTVQPKEFKPKEIINIRMKSITNYRGKMKLFVADLKDYIYRGYKVIILGGKQEKTKRLYTTLKDLGIAVRYEENYNSQINSSEVIITKGSINDGFEISDIKFIIINYSDIYGVGAPKKKSKKKKKLNFEDLTIGDYVVHEGHGIGKYIGTQRLEVQNIKKDYIVIEYKGEDKLFLPIENLDLIYKYIGKEGKVPKVNKLNSIEWSKTKTKAKKSIEIIAEDLIKLYAEREEAEGYQFSEDTEWQSEFEDAFAYEETEGQLTSSQEIKKDMESNRPMDRLLCADVGYGKTEVALRAAFKAVMDSKQVAFLVPTTILAQQHYNTIVERFKDFPIKVALLCRFRTKKEQQKDIEEIKNGFVDIVIGTHRILSKDVKFKDIGLLIIDEEQRFGVRDKEKLKILKSNVDTLTLTATPIPRTLQMSMIGIRDMSVIDEPPEERFPVQSYVSEYNDMLIRDAIIKEIERGGQVYFVYNRVANMEMKLAELRRLVPEATFGMAHGQMSERELEDTMVSFINKEFEVLLCSTIIETGMDVQNANTMIVTDANRLGLSQLYQLRGRIGRSNKIAYCYFTYEKDVSLSEVAQKRLKSIKEFTEFGSGYKIALRDLEIRGSGSILGAKQHGHIDLVGYDLYIKYLKEAVSKLKGEEVKEKEETQIDIKIDSYIPMSYIENELTRLEIYKKIAIIEFEEDYSDLIDELIDRFSEIPKQVSNLMDISLLRAKSREIDIVSITQKKDSYEIRVNELPNLSSINELQDNFKSIQFNLGELPSITISNLKYPMEDLKKAVDILKLHKKVTS